MKKFTLLLTTILSFDVAFGDATITSKQYVDTQIAMKQNTIPAANTNTVLTYTGTAGEIGQKAIYNENENYAEQQSALVTAGTADAAIQMAIDGEFVCANPPKCTLWTFETESSQNILPSGYTAVEYLQGNHSGSIDTGVVFNSGTLKFSVEIKTGSLTSLPSSGESDVIGNFTGNNVGPGFVGGLYCKYNSLNQRCTNADAFFFGWAEPRNLNRSSSTNEWHTLETEFADNIMTVTLDGVSQSENRQNYFNSAPIVLMGGSYSYYLARSEVKIRNIKIWRNNQLVRNYVTARNSNNEYGVYDLVNNTFTTTTNGDALLGGPDLNVFLPSGN